MPQFRLWVLPVPHPSAGIPLAAGSGLSSLYRMGAFLGCCVIALAVWLGLRRVGNELDWLGGMAALVVNERAKRDGEPPIITEDSLKTIDD